MLHLVNSQIALYAGTSQYPAQRRVRVADAAKAQHNADLQFLAPWLFGSLGSRVGFYLDCLVSLQIQFRPNTRIHHVLDMLSDKVKFLGGRWPVSLVGFSLCCLLVLSCQTFWPWFAHAVQQ